MLTIRAAQLDALRQHGIATHTAALAQALAADLPGAAAMSPAALDAALDGVLAQARAAGIVRSDDTARFAGLVFAGFDDPALRDSASGVTDTPRSAPARACLAEAFAQAGAAEQAHPASRDALKAFDARVARQFSTRPLGNVILPCGAEQARIEIVLLDLLDRPVAGERYRIVLPDGEEIAGQLDEQGSAWFDHLDPGNCAVSFPDLDRRVVARWAGP